MTTLTKKEKLKGFNNENEFREFLIDFLIKSDFKDVIHTHRYGRIRPIGGFWDSNLWISRANTSEKN